MEDLILNIQHRMNPLHVHCRLEEKGVAKPLSLTICGFYERFVFSWLNSLTILAILICQTKN